ncbi:hypothetical protein [uncultured Corynebacterium sp.]|uniref:hypothetical protein n=1 Tax=uncultured Corynebacterium sp. TaxID=159447 RepID=UPI0025EB9F58|nr:hypothetical protein [uncultured Corynebacterium sp.]
MSDDKDRPGGPNGENHGSDGNEHGSHRWNPEGQDGKGQQGYEGHQGYEGQQGYGADQYGSDQYGSGQYGQNQQGWDQNQQGYQGQYGQNQYGGDQYGQGQYDQNQYGGDQYGQNQYGQGQYGAGQWGEGQYGAGQYGAGQYGGQQFGAGQWNQQGYSDPGPGVAQPGGEVPPSSPVRSGPLPLNMTQPLATGFKRMNANIGPWLGFMALAIVSIIVVAFVFMFVILGGIFSGLSSFDPANPSGGPGAVGMGAALGAILLMYPVMFLIGFLVSVFMYRGAFEEIDGRRVEFGTFFRVTRWGSLFGAGILSAVIAFGAMIPGYVVLFLSVGLADSTNGGSAVLVFFAYLLIIAGAIFILPITGMMPMLVMDGRAKALESPAVAWNLVKSRFWSVLGSMVLISLVGSLGIIACYVGALYTMPVSMIAYVELYRQLVGGRRPVPTA